MKKVLVVLLVLCVGAGAFAQVTPYGSLRLDFGGSLSNDGSNNTGSYIFDALASGTAIGVRLSGDNFSGNVQWSPGDFPNAITGSGRVFLADIVGIEIGFNHLPSTFWAGLPFLGDGLYGNGNTGLGQDAYFKLDAFGAFLGAAAPGLAVAGVGSLDTDGQTPIFFLGYDFTPESNVFSAGFTFTFQKREFDGDGSFPIMATIHGLVHPTETIEIKGNVGLSMARDNFQTIVHDGAVGRGAGAKSVVLEGLVNAQFGLTETLGLVVAFGGAGDISDKDKGGGYSHIYAGLSAQIGLNENFSISPGLNFGTVLNSGGPSNTAKGFDMKYGVSLGYSF